MPKVPRPVSKPRKCDQLQGVPPAAEYSSVGQATARASQSQAIAKILEGARARGEGKRILLLGATRKGKTTFARKLIRGMLSTGVCQVALVHDQKNPEVVQYEGSNANNPEDLRSQIVSGERLIVCRHGLTVEDAAAAEREAVECGVPTALVVDEVTPALKVNTDGEPMERVWCGPSPIWILLQGGGLGASLVLNAQLPRNVPSSMVDNAECYVFFNLGGRSLEYSIDLHLLPREAVQVVKRLSEGECCIFFSDRDWDRTVYGPA